MIKYVRAGDRVEIGFSSPEGAKHKKLVTAVETVLNDKDVLVLMPVSSGSMIKLPVNRKYEAKFYTGSSVYVYDITITEHPVINDVFLTKFRLDSKGEKVQVRDFYRVDTYIKFTFAFASESLLETEKPPESYQAVTQDLSAGGMSFSANEELADNTEIFATFVIDNEDLMVLGSAFGKRNVDGEFKYSYRCKFLGVPDAEREKLVKYVNSQQFKSGR